MAEPKPDRFAGYDVKRLQQAVQSLPRQMAAEPRIAILVPCYNEACTIAQVVRDFRAALPQASIFVYDNNSTDGTASLANEAGAEVRTENLQGKGNVVRRMFADVDADVYVLVDGDGTYDAACAPEMVRRLVEGDLDMVNAARDGEENAYRSGHRFGNVLLSRFVAAIFGSRITDILSGYRAFSRRFVKSFPGLSQGFEIETEFTVHALELRLPVAEIHTPYRARPQGSASKLATYRDGFRILVLIFILIKEERPLQFFGVIAALLAVGSIGLVVPVLIDYVATGLVPRLPTAVLATGTMLLAFLSLTCGLILETVTRGRKEMKRLHYLAVSK